MKLFVVRVLYWFKSLFEDPMGLFRALGVESGDIVLEIGCAIGYHTLPLARIASPGQVYAVDIWEEGLAYLKHKTGPDERIEIICGGAETVELPPSSLDKVVCFDTLHDVPDFARAVVKWAGFLREGGKLLYLDPTIPADKIPMLSGGKLHPNGTIEGVHVFVRQCSSMRNA